MRLAFRIGHSLLSLAIVLQVHAQVVRLSDPEGNVIAEVSDKHKPDASKPDRLYFWVRSQTIFSTQGGASGILLHGQYTAYFPGGQLREKGGFHLGLKHGEWRKWDDQGRLRLVEHWRKGVLDGPSTHFDETGAPSQMGRYRRGQLVAPRPEKDPTSTEPRQRKRVKPSMKRTTDAEQSKEKGTRVPKKIPGR